MPIKKKSKAQGEAQQCDVPAEGGKLEKFLAGNLRLIRTLFEDVDILRIREFCNADNTSVKYAICYFEGITDSDLINQHIIKPLILAKNLENGPELPDTILYSILSNNEVTNCSDVQELIVSISYGDTLLFVDGSDSAMVISSKNFFLRSVTEPEGERVLSGPREGFVESIMVNLSMVRRRILSQHLKLQFVKLGVQSKTSVCIAYMDNIVNKKILEELRRRMEGIGLDAILDSNYIAEYIVEKSVFGFSVIGSTERPDVVVGKLMEGRIALFVDGTPVVLTLPYLFVENFQSSEDYYMNPIYASFSRSLRMLCFFLTSTVSAVYIAIVGYHQEILPPSLMISFAGARAKAPLPAAIECFLVLFMFDILRETGIRMPLHIGQAMSIVGALVIGQSAVEANLIAAPMIIIVALTGITILLVPRLTTASLFARYMCLVLSCMLGITGLMVGISVLIIHLLNLESFGIPYILNTKDLNFQDVKDTFIRVPWPQMITRVWPLASDNIRQRKYKSKINNNLQ